MVSEEIANDPPETQVYLGPEMETPAGNIDQQPDAVISSPIREARPSEAAVIPPSHNVEDGTVIAATATAPDSSSALGKSSLEAMPSQGKDKLDLSSLESTDSNGLHEALQTRLFESQEIAKSLANKQKVSL
jgi:hypothetical protein